MIFSHFELIKPAIVSGSTVKFKFFIPLTDSGQTLNLVLTFDTNPITYWQKQCQAHLQYKPNIVTSLVNHCDRL